MFIFHILYTHYVENFSIEILQFIDNGLIRHEICPNLFVNVTRWRGKMKSEILLNKHLNSKWNNFHSNSRKVYSFLTYRNYHYNIFKATSEIFHSFHLFIKYIKIQMNAFLRACECFNDLNYCKLLLL